MSIDAVCSRCGHVSSLAHPSAASRLVGVKLLCRPGERGLSTLGPDCKAQRAWTSRRPRLNAQTLESQRSLVDRIGDFTLRWVSALAAVGVVALIGLIIYKVDRRGAALDQHVRDLVCLGSDLECRHEPVRGARFPGHHALRNWSCRSSCRSGRNRDRALPERAGAERRSRRRRLAGRNARRDPERRPGALGHPRARSGRASGVRAVAEFAHSAGRRSSPPSRSPAAPCSPRSSC